MFDFLDQRFAGATIRDYTFFGLIALLTLLIRRPVTALICRIISKLAIRLTGGKYRRLFIGLLNRPVLGLITTGLLFFAFNRIDKPLNDISLAQFYSGLSRYDIPLSDAVHHIFLFATIFYISWIFSRFTDFFYRAQINNAHTNDRKDKLQIIPLLREVIKILIWISCGFWLLGAVFHVNVPAIITGLGIGGIAIALAAKETLENLFASFTILLDKPLQAGDEIRLDLVEGVVERIGFRSTRIRTADGSVVIIPNKKLVDNNLENLSQRISNGSRIALFINPGIPLQKLEAIKAEIFKMVSGTHHVIEPVHIALESQNEKAITLIITYHLPHPLLDSTPKEMKEEILLKAYGIVQQVLSNEA